MRATSQSLGDSRTCMARREKHETRLINAPRRRILSGVRARRPEEDTNVKQVASETVYEMVGDDEVAREVPCYVPTVGESVNDVATKLGLRPLGRRESGHVVALVASQGLRTRRVQS